MTIRPLILITNDDGYGSVGIEAMASALLDEADVVIVAPETEQSACSHTLTLHRALRLRRVAEARFALDGTPADCVYVSLYSGARIVSRRPELVISGLNHGVNLGYDVYYSGTVAGAREAVMRGVAGLAVSVDAGADLGAAALACASIAFGLLEFSRAGGEPVVLNVNVPPGRSWPMRATRLGRRLYGDRVEYRSDPRGKEYLWIGGPFLEHENEPGTDTDAFERGEIGVSTLPLVLRTEETDRAALEVVRWARRRMGEQDDGSG